MEIQITSVRDPVWANSENTLIDCFIRFTAYAAELPFTASPDDVEEHGREVFRRCIAGEFGKIGPYVEPLVEEDKSTDPNVPSWTTAWPEVHDFLIEANAENARGTSRGIGLVWGSMLEAQLKSFVLAQLKHQGRCEDSLKNKKGQRFGNSFNGWIEAAAFEKMIEPDVGKHLHAIRRIRNACAHQWQLDFRNPEISGLQYDFDILRLAYFPEFLLKDFYSLIKMVYSAACCRIIMRFTDQMYQALSSADCEMLPK